MTTTAETLATLATFNVDGVRARLDSLCTWLSNHKPTLVALQELKCPDDKFPHDAINAVGYRAYISGQKSFNGVALLLPIDAQEPQNLVLGLPNRTHDTQARYIQADVRIGKQDITIASVYCPNGNPVDRDEKFGYKQEWLHDFFCHVKELNQRQRHLVLMGDFNVAPTRFDLFCPDVTSEDAISHPIIRDMWRAGLANNRLCDAWRALNSLPASEYTEYSYIQNRLMRKHGFRIDFALLSASAVSLLHACEPDIETRHKVKASNHLPLFVTLWC